MKRCTFCGHSKIDASYEAVKAALLCVVSDLIQNEGYDSFLIGNYGQFDRLAASVCLALRREHPSISVSLVLPYYQPHLDSWEKAYCARFDDVIVPELEHTPYPYRIIRANEYMVDCSDAVISFVQTSVGGAAKTLAYAKRKKKRILRIAL